MTNSQLRTLLDRAPLCDEDKHNVFVIFRALPDERKIHILNHWEIYVAKLILERHKRNAEDEKELLATLKQMDTLLDEAIARQNEKNQQKRQMKKIIREELDSAVQYENMQKDRIIHSIGNFPSK